MPLNTDVTEEKPGMYLVTLDGRLDTDTSVELEKQLASVLAKDVRAMRFDMKELDYVSSMGIRALFKLFKTLKQKKAMFLMANLQPQIKKVLDIAKALPPETVFASIKEADAYFDEMQKRALAKPGEH